MESGKGHTHIDAAILEEHRRIAAMLAEDAGRVVSHARKNMDRWGWTSALAEGRASGFMREWDRLLADMTAGQADEAERVLTAGIDDERAVWLRASSPFAGLVDYRERWAIRAAVKEQHREGACA